MRAIGDAYPDLPVTLAMPGLVIGRRIGPYAEMEGYIRGASARLMAVTGRAPSEAFFGMIRSPGVRGDSGPPILAIDQVRRMAPDLGLDFAHRVTEAHFLDGGDLNRPETYLRLAEETGLGRIEFDLGDGARLAEVLEKGRRYGIATFPTLMLEHDGKQGVMPSIYDPGEVVDWIAETMRHLRSFRIA
jgi:putative protein-disulfide isomerase